MQEIGVLSSSLLLPSICVLDTDPHSESVILLPKSCAHCPLASMLAADSCLGNGKDFDLRRACRVLSGEIVSFAPNWVVGVVSSPFLNY